MTIYLLFVLLWGLYIFFFAYGILSKCCHLENCIGLILDDITSATISHQVGGGYSDCDTDRVFDEGGTLKVVDSVLLPVGPVVSDSYSVLGDLVLLKCLTMSVVVKRIPFPLMYLSS